MSGIEGPGIQGGGGGGGGIPTTASVITSDDETGTLPNSRELTAGTGITLDSATPGELIINSTAQGSTVPTTTQGDTLFASATNVLSALAKDTNATRYLANTGTTNNPAWAQVNLTNGVTGTLPVANGGTNSTSLGTSGQLLFNSAGAVAGSNMSTSGNVLTVGSAAGATINADSAPTTGSAGNALTIRAGAGGSVSGTGGALTLGGGVPVDGVGGSVTVAASAGFGTNRSGGAVTITGGASTGTAAGATLSGTGGAGGATGNGGTVALTGGAGGATSGTGGNVTLTGGTPVDGKGGSVTLTAANGVGTNRDGGNISFIGGTATGSGIPGSIVFANLTATGAQTATFTATNKPGSGTTTPSLWLRMVVSGTTYYVPMWQ